MAWSEHKVDVDRELELTVDVMESGVVRLQLTGGEVKAELGPGDRFVLVLRPVKPDETQSEPAGRDTWNSHKRRDWSIPDGAAALRRQVAGEDVPDTSEDSIDSSDANERGDH